MWPAWGIKVKALDEVCGLRQVPGRPISGKETRCRCIGGWVGHRAVWTDEENLAPKRFDPRTFQPIASRYTDHAIPATKRIEYKINSSALAGKSWRNGIAKTPRQGQGDDIEMYLKNIGWEGVDWIHLTQVKDKWQWTRYWTLCFAKLGEFFWLNGKLVARQERLYFMVSVCNWFISGALNF